MNSPTTRFSLIERIKNPQDMHAWGEFVDLYEPLIVETCLRKGMQHADATDIAQEVLTRVASKIEDFRHDQPQATFRGWLYRMTRNLTIDFIRQHQRDPLNHAAPASAMNDIAKSPDVETQEFHQSYQRRLFLLVAKQIESEVQPQTWAAFWKVEVEQKDPAEVAQELGLSRGGVYVAKSRVLKRLRKEVQRRLAETSEFPELGS